MNDPKNISKQIARYLDGEMNAQEQHNFEAECAKDPFLQDMLEGYKETSVSSSDIEDLSDSWSNKRGYTKRNKWILGISILALLLLFTALLFYIIPLSSRPSKREVAKKEKNTKKTTTEGLAENSGKLNKSISSEQIQKDQKEIDKFKNSKNFKELNDSSQDNEKNHIVEPLVTLPKSKVQIPKNNVVSELIKKKVNLKYFRNFKVMSYDQIRRENILLIREEKLSGVPASNEDELSNNNPKTQEQKKIDYNRYLEETIHLFSKEWYRKCLKNCKIILQQYPNDLNASFYGAMCLLNLKSNEKALPYFQNIINSPYDVYYDESLFYYALALKNSHPKKSKAILKKIASSNGFYAERAQKEISSFEN